MDRARATYEEAAALYKLGKYSEAAAKFEAAYQITKFPTMLFDVAQAYRRIYETNKDVDALKRSIDLYGIFLRDAGSSAEKRPIAANLIPQLTALLQSELARKRAQLVQKASGREGLFFAEQLMADGADQDAVIVLDRVLASPHNTRDVVVSAYEKRALVGGKLKQTEIATEAFKRVLAMEPSTTLAEGSPPSTTEAFEKARAAMRGKKQLKITHTPVAGCERGQAVPLTFSIEADPLQLIEQVAVFYRLAGGGAFSTAYAQKTTGKLEIPAAFISGVPPGTRIEYYVAALGEAEGELSTVGSHKEPYVLVVAGASELVSSTGKAGKPWYKKGWVWGVVAGVAVAGAGVGVGVYFGTRPAPFNPPSVAIPTQ